MEDSMIDRPNLAFDEKVSNKRDRDFGEEIDSRRLEKRPSGIIIDVKDGENVTKGGENGIIDTLISSVFRKDIESVTTEEEREEIEVKNDVKLEEDKGIIKDFFSNVFQNDDKNVEDQSKNELVNEVVDKNDKLSTSDCNVENKDLNAEKPTSKDLEGNKSKMKPDEYSERLFFLNNN